ncbi:RNA polymerase sigma factor [Dyadobacter tibetensis]|uniref:RNA polymerase sigma factor n=1 Tax=Dyadobacter tibetensis TaxID=1211851 RepID=UPI0004722FDC|nr:RNA polymerase sigma factor [Dyadobacter tibetensis]
MQEAELEYWRETCKGNSLAFEKLYNFYAADLFRFGYRISSDYDLVQDSVQDLFLHLWSKRHRLKEVQSPRFYLYRSLRNKLIRASESDRFLFSKDGELSEKWFPNEMDLLSSWISDETSQFNIQRLQEALLRLPIRQQEAIQLRYYHDFSAEEIGKIMDINVQSVRNLLNRAMQQLRADLPFFPISLLTLAFS